MPLIVALALFALAVALIALSPLFLSHGEWRLRYPRWALTLWYSFFLLGLAAAGTSLLWTVGTVALMRDVTRPTPVWLEPTVLVLLGWVGLACCGALIALVVSRVEPLAQAERDARASFSILAASADRSHEFGRDVVIVESDEPVALSIPGHGARVMVTSRLVAELSTEQARSVIEHERTHLAQRHSRFLQFAQLNYACLPLLPATRELERTTRLLVELIADDCAARACGAANTANALVRIGNLRSDESMLLRARRLASRPPRGSVRTSRVLRHWVGTVSL